MKKVAFLFPGQGSQVVGMGQDLYQEYDFVREIFDMVDEVTKTHISKLCFNGPNRPYVGGTACSSADFDQDIDVDLQDFTGFQYCFNGPNRPPAHGTDCF